MESKKKDKIENNKWSKKKKLIFFTSFAFIFFFLGAMYIISDGSFKYQTTLEKFFTDDSFSSASVFDDYETVRAEDYYELLIATSDTIPSKQPRENWTDEMFKKERAGNVKQGYVVTYKEGGYNWGKLERDPKRFAIVRVLKENFNESWLEPEYNYSAPIMENIEVCEEICTVIERGAEPDCREVCTEQEVETKQYEILTERKYVLPIEEFMDTTEIDELKKIEYNSEVDWVIAKDIESIETKIADVNYETKNITSLILHGSSGTFSICTSGCDYTSLSTWEAGENSDLTGTGPCIATINESFKDTEALMLFGWTTTESDYIKINVTDDARHNGIWNDSKYHIEVDSDVITLRENWVYIDGIQSHMNSSSGLGSSIFSAGWSDRPTNHYIDKCIARVSGTGNNNGITSSSYSVNVTIRNCLVYRDYGVAQSTGDEGILISAATSNVKVYNTNVYNWNDGIERDQGTVNVINSIVFGNADDFDGTMTITYSASDDIEAGTGNVNGLTWNDEFINYTNNNFHIVQGHLFETGQDLSTYFSEDIDGDTRADDWDIGADEIIDIKYPQINFQGQTPDNDAIETNSSVEINVSIGTESLLLGNVTINWDGTETTFFDDSIVSMYNFDNLSALGESSTAALDVSGNGNNGTINGATYTSSGKHNGAYDFDGSDDYMSAGTAQGGMGEITVSAWVNSDTISGAGGVLLDSVASKWDATANKRAWILGINRATGGGKVSFTVSSGSLIAHGYESNDAEISANTWHHLVGTWDGSSNTFKIYVDGESVDISSFSASGTMGSTIYNTDSQVQIGSAASWGSNRCWFDGTVDEVRVWEKVLSDDEVKEMYNSNLRKLNTSAWELYVNETNLVGNNYIYNVTACDVSNSCNTSETRTLSIVSSSIVLNESTWDLQDLRVIAYDENEQGVINLSGSYYGNAPTMIEARVFRNDTGATVQVNGSDWTNLSGITIGDGKWSGLLTNINKTNSWLNFQVRDYHNNTINDTSINKVGVGYVVLLTGQSYVDLWLDWNELPYPLEQNNLTSKFRDPYNQTVRSLGNESYYSGWALATGNGGVTFANILQEELDCPIGLLDYGYGASSLLEVNELDGGWWLGSDDPYNRLRGTSVGLNYSELLNRRKANAILWYQGYTDAVKDESYIDYLNGLGDLFPEFESITNFDEIPIFIVENPRCQHPFCINRNESYYNLKLAQRDKAVSNEVDNYYFAGSPIDLELDDSLVHLTEDANIIEARRYAQSILWHEVGTGNFTYHRGPYPLSYNVINNTHTLVTLIHDGGTNFTPTEAIDSFQVYNGTTWISATGIWNSSNKIILNHASGTISNVRTNYGVNPKITNLVKDDTYLQLPIETVNSTPEEESADTCTYTSGNWIVDCSDNCLITSNVNLGGNNITISGTGIFSTTANITGFNKLKIEGTDSSNICRVRCSGNGCFR